MQKSFDNILSNKIKNTFENHQEPLNPVHWQKMKKKLAKEKKQRIIWLPIFAKTAVILILFGITALIFYKIGQNSIEKNKYAKIINSNNVKIYSNSKKYNIDKKNSQNINNSNQYTKNIKKSVKSIPDTCKTTQNSNVILIKKNNNSLTSIEKHTTNNTLDTANNTLLSKKDTLSMKKDTLIAEINNIQNINNTNKEILQKNKKNRFQIGVELSSLYNYSNSSSALTNFSTGLHSEFAISKHISLSSGLLVCRQNFDMTSNSTFWTENNSTTEESSESNTENFITNFSEEYTVLAIDIPLNIQLNIKRISITSGVSSLAYLYEKHETNYKEQIFDETNTLLETNNINKIEKNIFPKNNSFDFAKLINFSFGYSIPLKKGSLLIEPYLKYPIGKMTSQNIKLGSTGISLRYNFNKK